LHPAASSRFLLGRGGDLICSYCNHENPDNFYFCGACGKPVRGAASKLEPGFQSEPRQEAYPREAPSSATNAATDEARGAGLSTIDPELYPRRAGEVAQPVRLPSGYRSSLLGISPESDEPEYSYLLEEDRPSRWRFLVTAIILFTLGALAYWQVSSHGGISGVVNAFRSAEQQNQQRRASKSNEAPLPTNAPIASNADDSTSASNQATNNTAPATTAPAAAAKPSAPVAGNHPAVAEKHQAQAPTTREANGETTSDKELTKDAAETTQQASLRQPEPAAAPVDDENTRLAEKYLYGQGVPQDCNRAVGLIKPAASSDNPKAQSMLGTMYATGHCVPRDLPTSYRYFALSLRQQPRNQWVEKDMEMVWNQMNPSEKQLASRLAK
jgi:hypothetical protein